MEFRRLLELVGDEPVFETSFLLAGDVDPADVRRQLSRWTAAGRLFQLRRGLYALAPPFQKVKPHPFLVANRLRRPSYVSCQSALAFYSLIPEHTPLTVSATTTRPGRWDTALGAFEFHHVAAGIWRGYGRTDLGGGQWAFVASPEKAILDLVHLTPGGDTRAYLEGLRLQNLEKLSVVELHRLAEAAGSPKLRRAAAVVSSLAAEEAVEYTTL